ncbi:MAG: hypothetical protein MN733_10520, partial [Nitrososphaera sp.]|nr:hypothetical protein [Nitrososphaera sp.]
MDSNGSLNWNTFLGSATASAGGASSVTASHGTIYVARNDIVYPANVSYAFVTRIDDPIFDCSGTILSPVAQAVQNVTGEQEYYCGNHYDSLITVPPGENAFQSFRVLAETAIEPGPHEIDFATMGWDRYDPSKEDNPGRIFLQGIQTLYSAVDANPEDYPGGVRVRILLGLKSYLGSKDQRLNVMLDLNQLGIPREDTNWKVEVAYHDHSQGKHSHVKTMIVDGKQVIVAGYNMHYNYLDLPDIPPVHDMGIQVSGPIAYRALQVFDHLWAGAHRCDWPNATYDGCAEEADVDTSHNAAVLIPTITGNDAVFSLFRDHTDKTADNAIEVALSAASSEVNIIQNRFVNDSFFFPPQFVDGILNAIENEEVNVKLLVSSGDGSAIGQADRATNIEGVCILRAQIWVRN